MAIAIYFMSPHAQALDLFTVISDGCQTNEGIVIYADDRNIEMITLSGKARRIPRKTIDFVIIHNTYENPFKNIPMGSEVKSRLKEVYVQSTDRPDFIGWPVKFIENLIIFYDTMGRTHVLELEKILRLRPHNKKMGHLRLKATSPNLKYGDSIGPCSKALRSAKRGIIPTRVLGDKIQISEFFNNFEDGYERANSFQERTYLYAKPFLFDKPTKLGITLYQEPFENPALLAIPAFVQWSTGRPYRFQSFNQIGFVAVEDLPTVEPLLLSRSEVKSHFFHGSFTGNLHALPAGTEYYTKFSNDDKSQNTPFGIEATGAGSAVNYMALMGVDYEAWSASIGTSYSTHFVQAKTYFREILASEFTPVFRLMYTRKNYRLRGIIGRLDLSKERVTDFDIAVDRESSVEGIIDNFSFSHTYLRLGIDYNFDASTVFGAGVLYSDNRFSETLSSGPTNVFDWGYRVGRVYIHKYFGEYVSIKVYGNFMEFQADMDIAGLKSSENRNGFFAGGQFEFVF